MELAMSGRNISKNTKLQDITNYTIWMYKLRTLLQGECLWNVVNPFNVPTVESSSINSLHLQQTTKDTMQDNVLETFKNFKITVEKETNYKILCLKSDLVGKYISREFTYFYF
uniref:DUF4219 domain-containing protein n=2 Tax=Physcomitrium patens TaxID=3218 RepID=A0A7I4DJF6_PHYPA